jgi:hypothetical protein
MGKFFIGLLLVGILLAPTIAYAQEQIGSFYVDRIIFKHTPQTGDWQMCFTLYHPDGTSITFQPNQDWEDDPVDIDVQGIYKEMYGEPFELTDVKYGSKLSFDIGLDDDYNEACGSPEDYFQDVIPVKRKGEKSYYEGDEWDLTIRYHWKAY